MVAIGIKAPLTNSARTPQAKAVEGITSRNCFPRRVQGNGRVVVEHCARKKLTKVMCYKSASVLMRYMRVARLMFSKSEGSSIHYVKATKVAGCTNGHLEWLVLLGQVCGGQVANHPDILISAYLAQ